MIHLLFSRDDWLGLQNPYHQHLTESIIKFIYHQSLAFNFNSLKNELISILPPLIMQHTFFPLNLSSFSTAATVTAPDGSITIFILSNTNWVAAIIYSSETRITSSGFKCSFMMPNVLSPRLPLRPSAIEIGGNWGCLSFFSKESLASLPK